jgi:hypothetical protein
MKKYVWLVLLALIAVSVSGCAVRFGRQQPVVVVPPQAPVTVFVPDYYIWDGAEYIGWCGTYNRYVYWGATGWLVCSPEVTLRFDRWMSHYPTWRRESKPYHRGEWPNRYR